MTKDLAILVGPSQPHLTTQDFLAAIDTNLVKAMQA
jgi:isocitrate dehydrogenase